MLLSAGQFSKISRSLASIISHYFPLSFSTLYVCKSNKDNEGAYPYMIHLARRNIKYWKRPTLFCCRLICPLPSASLGSLFIYIYLLGCCREKKDEERGKDFAKIRRQQRKYWPILLYPINDLCPIRYQGSISAELSRWEMGWEDPGGIGRERNAINTLYIRVFEDMETLLQFRGINFFYSLFIINIYKIYISLHPVRH